MTLTAMRPDWGLSKGREASLWRLSQRSSLISALRVALRALYGSLAPKKQHGGRRNFFVAAGVGEPAGDTFGPVAADLTGVGVPNSFRIPVKRLRL